MSPAAPRVMCAVVVLALCAPAHAQTTSDAPGLRPDAIVDLTTTAGAALLHATWRYSDARLVEVEHRAPGADLRASGPAVRALDIEPKAGAAGFDDSRWPVVAPEALQARRTNGRLAFGWYRTSVTIPERLGALDVRDATAILEVVVDDYAEIWVEGRLPVALGQTGGALVKGFNAPNRVVLTEHAVPGQTIHVAIFGANGPLSNPPSNFVWVRSATVDFYRRGRSGGISAVELRVQRQHPAIDTVVPADATLEKVAGGFLFTEGPVWAAEGALLFSDPNANAIYRWVPSGQVSVFRTKSGYAGVDAGEFGQPGSNGLTFDADGRLTIGQHGNRRVIRLEKTGAVTVLAERYDGRRLNSPNDLVYRSDGTLYFTDPPFGLPKAFEDARKELPFSGVYAVKDGRVRLLAHDLNGPNGLAFSPDERYLYVGNWDPARKVAMRYPVHDDGSLGPGVVFADMTAAPGDDAIDGIKVDVQGHVYVSGPGGVWIFTADGTHLGTLSGPEQPHNLAWGDDGRTLYLTAQTGVYRLRLLVPGVRPGQSRD